MTAYAQWKTTEPGQSRTFTEHTDECNEHGDTLAQIPAHGDPDETIYGCTVCGRSAAEIDKEVMQ